MVFLTIAPGRIAALHDRLRSVHTSRDACTGPFCCCKLHTQSDHKGPQLFQIDPSGSYFEWKATSIGKGFVNAKTFLEKRHHDGMELEDAIHTAILTLKDSFEGACACA